MGEKTAKCILHIGVSASSEKIIPFTDASLKNCYDKKQFRDSTKQKISKFDGIILPGTPNGLDGYHPSCYRYFCAVKQIKYVPENENEISENRNEVQSNDSETSVSSNNEIETLKASHAVMDTFTNSTDCVFCGRRFYRKNAVIQRTIKSVLQDKENRIIELLKITKPDIDSSQISGSIYYHVKCFSEAQTKHMKNIPKNHGSQQINGATQVNIHSKIYSAILDHIKETIIDKNEIRALANIHSFYDALYQEELVKHPNYSIEANFKPQHLLRKLLQSFSNITKTVYRNQTFLHKSDLTMDEILAKGCQRDDDLENRIKSVAFDIRKKLLAMEKRKLPTKNLLPHHITQGECNVPSDLNLLIKSIVNGPKKNIAPQKQTRISSICHSLIFTMSNGSIKPSTCLELALATKSMTGSRKMINILNRLGHCVSYTTTEELETELAYGCSALKGILPYGLIKNNAQLRTHVAFDNFDRFVETSTGKDTLHDTVGIVYQNSNVIDETVPSNGCDENFNDINPTGVQRRRKYYSPFDNSIEPYAMSNRRTMSIIGKELRVPDKLTKSFDLDNLWMMSHAFNIEHTKRWFAWNSERVTNDLNPIQRIGYLPNINMSPTSDAVVRKTMEVSLDIAKECDQNYIIVTYDLAIASKAYRIQAEMSPNYDKLFINLGAFHAQLSYFKAIGKYIDSSGLTRILIESGLIAEGSIKGFISGSHFNRCKKIHAIAALTLKQLHFESFFETYNKMTHEQKMDLKELIDILQENDPTPQGVDLLMYRLKDILNHYDSYTRETMNGHHGCTAKFFWTYVRLMDYYQLFESAIRSCDIEMYIYAAIKMCALFFTFNHQNYARWMTKNLDTLMNIEETHPGLLEDLEGGALSIRRTTKNFCRSPIDLTLEQTINSNAGNKLTGITAFRNSLCAKQKWSETHIARTTISTHLLEFLGLIKLSDDSDSQYHSKHFKKKVNQFKEEVCKNINPFGDDLNKTLLFNISSGRAASKETTDFLVEVEINGTKQMENFVQECRVDNQRFERPLKRNVIKNFTAEIFQGNKILAKYHSNAAKVERNILAQVLILALDKKIDFLNVLGYPLTTFPQSLTHPDGSMITNYRNNDVAELLMANTEMTEINIEPPTFEIDVIDGFHLLNGLRDTPVKYGQLAEYFLKRICNTDANEIHIIFDQCERPSPKDVQMKNSKELYENSSLNFRIIGPNQERYAGLQKSLANNNFKNELIKFFISYWSEQAIESILETKRIFVSFGSKCYLFSNDFEKGKLLTRFENNHFEVESKMISHAYQFRANNIRFRTSNVDSILVYLLYHMQFWVIAKNIWIEKADIQKNTIQMINVRHIFNKLNPTIINALPAWHAFTGCSYEPSFYGKGKKTCFKALQNSITFQNAFGTLGGNSNVNLQNELISQIEEFTCQLYHTKALNVNQSRLEIFRAAYGENGVDFNKKGIDFKNMPPCRKVLLGKIKRTDHLARMIKNACDNNINESIDGWLINEHGLMEIEYFDGNQFPCDITECTEKDIEESDTELGSSDEESDSDQSGENEDYFG